MAFWESGFQLGVEPVTQLKTWNHFSTLGYGVIFLHVKEPEVKINASVRI